MADALRAWLRELGRPEEALDFYDRALKVASVVPELQFSMMTHTGRANALVRLKLADEADQILTKALFVADRQEARGASGGVAKQQRAPRPAAGAD